MSEKHDWQFRLVWRSTLNNKWMIRPAAYDEGSIVPAFVHSEFDVVIIQRRRRRDHLDPTPCEGIEDPIWRDWIASDDPQIQGVLIAKGMPFRSLEK